MEELIVKDSTYKPNKYRKTEQNIYLFKSPYNCLPIGLKYIKPSLPKIIRKSITPKKLSKRTVNNEHKNLLKNSVIIENRQRLKKINTAEYIKKRMIQILQTNSRYKIMKMKTENYNQTKPINQNIDKANLQYILNSKHNNTIRNRLRNSLGNNSPKIQKPRFFYYLGVSDEIKLRASNVMVKS